MVENFNEYSVALDQVAGKHNRGTVCSRNRCPADPPLIEPCFQLHRLA